MPEQERGTQLQKEKVKPPAVEENRDPGEGGAKKARDPALPQHSGDKFQHL